MTYYADCARVEILADMLAALESVQPYMEDPSAEDPSAEDGSAEDPPPSCSSSGEAGAAGDEDTPRHAAASAATCGW